VQLAHEPLARLLVLLRVFELHAVGAVDLHGIDAEPLQRLQDRLPRAAEVGDALLRLRAPGRPLEHEHVGERMARADDRRPLPGGASDLVVQGVHLEDRLAQVPVVDLVVRHG
jgi:hypothetical protein